MDRIAKKINLDLERFNKDMNSPELRAHMNSDIADASKFGITGTPTIFVNGRKIKQRSFNGFQKLIDQELKKVQ